VKDTDSVTASDEIVNCLTIDLEDWYQTHLTTRQEIFHYEDRVERATHHVLNMLDEYGARATFFVVGFIAKKKPHLIEEVAARGHEIATHGWSHRLIYELGPKKFSDELDRSRKICEDIIGQEVIGHRGACWSITEDSLWALDILSEQNFIYDSSIFPTKNYLFGIPGAPRHAWHYQNQLLEIPPSTLRWAGRTVPIAGGFFLRILPSYMIRYGIRRLNREGYPAVVYFHPWEFDLTQPRNLNIPTLDKLIHYQGLGTAERKFRSLLTEFQFKPINQVFLKLFKPKVNQIAV